MALGILEPAIEQVPGTVVAYQVSKNDEDGFSNANSHSSAGPRNLDRIIRVPQPSDDPNDPLNWPLWQRDVILSILCITAVIATTASPLLAADSVTLALNFGIKFEAAALLTAYHLAGVGVGSLICVPLARVWGKRHLFLLGSMLMVASSAWGGSTHRNHNYASLLWARVMQGVALAPFESLVNACVGDLYFVHERGVRMAFATVSLFGGAFLTPVFVGMIAHNPSLGWQWSFYFISIFMGAGFITLFFFVPETGFERTHHTYHRPMTELAPLQPGSMRSESSQWSDEKQPRVRNTSTTQASGWSPLFTRLAPFSGRKTTESFWILFLRPFPLFLHPAVAWACLTQGVIIGWTVMVGVILSLIFLGPPLFLDEVQAGKKYTAAFVGSVIGFFLSGLYTEVVTRFMVRRNHGIYEPEFRILLVIPTLACAAAGLYGFGITAAHVARYGSFVPEVFLALIVVSMVMGATASAQYLLDAHEDIAVESFTCLIVFKNMFCFILAYFAYTWVFEGGITRLFVIFGSIEMGICLLSVPMYIFGKRNRAFFFRHDILRTVGLR
ncbi:synaptic vesicle transporter [Delphinella strobiligena]|nr:synaptic vesicle transporter [Delphinella strobiligena]